ncbi:septum formation initiator family protein [Vagococcus entomophilus]|uniref:Septum formation initiator n=1 Tax=Vagococcus entomophilus TaxID=1160095 RepID=A0A430AEX7_9ENTE|nr:septum formation initiator family protein [Vagococcus entomophilus]RSU06137.1 hypothetical protein CBF30_10475 [Vagococcus entomophilus]
MKLARKNVSNIASLDNHYTKKQMKHFQKTQKQLVFRRRRLSLLFVIAAIFLLVSSINIYKNYRELQTLKAEKQTVLKQQKTSAAQKKELTDEVNLLKDTSYVEKLARSKYYLSKDGEKVYNYPQGNETESSK